MLFFYSDINRDSLPRNKLSSLSCIYLSYSGKKCCQYTQEKLGSEKICHDNCQFVQYRTIGNAETPIQNY